MRLVSKNGVLWIIVAFMLFLDLRLIAEVIDIMNSPQYEAGLDTVNWRAVFFYLFIFNGIIVACFMAMEKEPKPIYLRPKTTPTRVTGKMPCPYCNQEILIDSAFCSKCGKELPPQQMYCAKCGAKLQLDSQFCAICGSKV